MAVRLSTRARSPSEHRVSNGIGPLPSAERTATSPPSFTLLRSSSGRGLAFCGGLERSSPFRLEAAVDRLGSLADQPEDELLAEAICLREAMNRSASQADRDRAWAGGRLELLHDELAIRTLLCGRPRRGAAR